MGRMWLHGEDILKHLISGNDKRNSRDAVSLRYKQRKDASPAHASKRLNYYSPAFLLTYYSRTCLKLPTSIIHHTTTIPGGLHNSNLLLLLRHHYR
ncbi:hypothetical protein A359_05400 [secondary endosymbiont of Ctenarytaina eucalypti]|uniref:Uncharacterized protein n=1 Tax=secondary endosymbiont of Ctenarytaina eucalypti TaxID=1199245 RepID=J3TFF0_9ENTR|nr:hypothetical protein A359_05400 [secondary endosymbiont of Ctenarytaina eucalypti]